MTEAIKRKRGRPPKYATEEERKAARKAARKIYRRKYEREHREHTRAYAAEYRKKNAHRLKLRRCGVLVSKGEKP